MTKTYSYKFKIEVAISYKRIDINKLNYISLMLQVIAKTYPDLHIKN